MANDYDISFLPQEGEMSKLTRSLDWSKTSLGSPDKWPQSLRTTLSIILNSKFPMFFFWGKDLICFYNDAYRPSLGNDGKHPSILGMKAKNAWPEIWEVIKPLIDQVLETGGATWSEDQLIPIYRNGKVEDVYWTFSYSAVNNELNEPAGVLVTCSETTEKIINQQKLEDSNNQLSFAIDAAELATYDYYPVTNKFLVNDRLKDWFGLNSKSTLQDSMKSVLPQDHSKVIKAVEQALDFTTGGHFDIEYTIAKCDTREERTVNSKGKVWFNEEKIAYRLNGTIRDITNE